MAASTMAATTSEARRGRATAFALCQGWAAAATSSGRRNLVHHRKKWMVLMFDGLYRIVRRGLWHARGGVESKVFLPHGTLFLAR